MFEISFIRHKPPNELSSTLPTNGDTYAAPAFAASNACEGENIRVTLTLINFLDNSLHTARPSGVQGTLIVANSPNLFASLVHSSYISFLLPTTSILTSRKPISISS